MLNLEEFSLNIFIDNNPIFNNSFTNAIKMKMIHLKKVEIINRRSINDLSVPTAAYFESLKKLIEK